MDVADPVPVCLANLGGGIWHGPSMMIVSGYKWRGVVNGGILMPLFDNRRLSAGDEGLYHPEDKYNAFSVLHNQLSIFANTLIKANSSQLREHLFYLYFKSVAENLKIYSWMGKLMAFMTGLGLSRRGKSF